MKPHRRIRKTIKWGATAASIMLLAAWIGSGWYAISWTSSIGARWELSEGRLTFNHLQVSMPEEYRGLRTARTQRFSLQWDVWMRNPVYMWKVGVPLWLFLPPLIALTVFTWRADIRVRRRRRAGVCPGCGYDRSGLPTTAMCPECASPPE